MSSNEKIIKSRQQQKTDVSTSWKIAGDNGFIPKKGEIIVYGDLNKIKIGDGIKNVNDLSFTNGGVGLITEQGGEIFNDYEDNVASGNYSHAEGANTKAGGEASHTEGYNTKTATEFQYQILNKGEIIGPEDGYQGNYYITLYLNSIQGLSKDYEITFNTSNDYLNDSRSFINEINEKNNSIIIYSQDQDGDTIKNTDFSTLTKAYLYIYDHPELGSIARNGAPYAHAEGNSTQALGEASHAEGKNTQATGNYSHAGGLGTIASAEAQTVIGKYNQEVSDALFVIGNGDTNGARNNAFTVDKDGNVKVSGNLQSEGADFNNTVAFHDDVTMDNALEIRSFATVDEVSDGYDGKSVVNVEYLNAQLNALITVADIDTICGGNIVAASEVTF